MSRSAVLPASAGAQERPLATCFWEGPISTERPSTRGFDGRTFNYPEESATYWLARFRLPAGSRLELRGDYPHGRYMSVNAYSDGAPTDALSDIDIAAAPGARTRSSPAHAATARAAAWRVTVVDEPVPASDREPNTIYARPSRASRSSSPTASTSPTAAATSPAAPDCRRRCCDRRRAARRRAGGVRPDQRRQPGHHGRHDPRARRGARRRAAATPPGVRPGPLGALLQPRLLVGVGAGRLHGRRVHRAPSGGSPRCRAACTPTRTAPTSSRTSIAGFGKVVVLAGDPPPSSPPRATASASWRLPSCASGRCAPASRA